MNLKQVFKVTLVVLAISSLAACSSLGGSSGAAGGQNKNAQSKAEGMGDQVGFSEEGQDKLKAPANQIYHFDFNKYDVQDEDVASVNAQGNYLASHSTAKVRLEGNADERGSREYNVALGWKRAKSVSAVLSEQGVAKSQINTVSYGKEKPVATGHDEDAYKLNRRVELIYEAK